MGGASGCKCWPSWPSSGICKGVDDKLAQVGPVYGGRGNIGGDREAARQLGVTRQEVQRSHKIASLEPEAKDTARRVGLDDNQAALLEAAAQPAEQQAAYLDQRAANAEKRKEERKAMKKERKSMRETEAKPLPMPKSVEEVEDDDPIARALSEADAICKMWKVANKLTRKTVVRRLRPEIVEMLATLP